MTRGRFLTGLVALITIGVVGAVVYLESADASSAAATTTTTLPATTTLSPTTTLLPTTTPPTTIPPTTILPTTILPTTLPPTTIPPTTIPPTTLPPPERWAVPVVVSSGSTSGQRLKPTAYIMSAAGWTDIRDLNGSIPLVETTIFYLDGFQSSAEQFAVDASVPITAIAPMSEAPPVAGLGNAALLMYLGGA